MLGTDTNLPQRSAADYGLDTVIVDMTLRYAAREVRLSHEVPFTAQRLAKFSITTNPLALT